MNTTTTTYDSRLPTYTKKEESVHVASHALGVILGFIVIIYTSINYREISQLTSGIIFGLSLVILYTISCVYHGLLANGKELSQKKKMQIADHSSVCLLIMGTIVPFALCLLEPAHAGFGWGVLLVGTLVSLTITTLNIIDLERFKVINTIGYFALAAILFTGIEVIYNSLPLDGFILFISGGAAYALGALFYGFGGKRNYFKKAGVKSQKWMHAIYHVFCIVGSVIHTVCIYLYVFGV